MASREDALAARRWFIVDADSRVVGRVATQIANVLRGKHKPTFTPHVDTGDFVVVVNAAKVRLTGAKLTDKVLPPPHRLARAVCDARQPDV